MVKTQPDPLATIDQLDAELLARRARLASAVQAQSAELRARQQGGQQRVGPWAPSGNWQQAERGLAVARARLLTRTKSKK